MSLFIILLEREKKCRLKQVYREKKEGKKFLMGKIHRLFKSDNKKLFRFLKRYYREKFIKKRGKFNK